MPKLLDEIINKKHWSLCELYIKRYTQTFFFKPFPLCFGITDSVTENELNLDVTGFVEALQPTFKLYNSYKRIKVAPYFALLLSVVLHPLAEMTKDRC